MKQIGLTLKLYNICEYANGQKTRDGERLGLRGMLKSGEVSCVKE